MPSTEMEKKRLIDIARRLADGGSGAARPVPPDAPQSFFVAPDAAADTAPEDDPGCFEYDFSTPAELAATLNALWARRGHPEFAAFTPVATAATFKLRDATDRSDGRVSDFIYEF